jgi:ribose 5-phosphate isomerase B
MKIAIASDHSAVHMKEELVKILSSKGNLVIDYGPYNTTPVDYPDYAHLVCNSLSDSNADIGILMCATGIGMSITANRNHNIRAALCHNTFTALKARQHNDANVLVMGAKIVSIDESLEIVNIFLNTSFEGGRHLARIEKI